MGLPPFEEAVLNLPVDSTEFLARQLYDTVTQEFPYLFISSSSGFDSVTPTQQNLAQQLSSVCFTVARAAKKNGNNSNNDDDVDEIDCSALSWGLNLNHQDHHQNVVMVDFNNLMNACRVQEMVSNLVHKAVLRSMWFNANEAVKRASERVFHMIEMYTSALCSAADLFVTCRELFRANEVSLAPPRLTFHRMWWHQLTTDTTTSPEKGLMIAAMHITASSSASSSFVGVPPPFTDCVACLKRYIINNNIITELEEFYKTQIKAFTTSHNLSQQETDTWLSMSSATTISPSSIMSVLPRTNLIMYTTRGLRYPLHRRIQIIKTQFEELHRNNNNSNDVMMQYMLQQVKLIIISETGRSCDRCSLPPSTSTFFTSCSSDIIDSIDVFRNKSLNNSFQKAVKALQIWFFESVMFVEADEHASWQWSPSSSSFPFIVIPSSVQYALSESVVTFNQHLSSLFFASVSVAAYGNNYDDDDDIKSQQHNRRHNLLHRHAIRKLCFHSNNNNKLREEVCNYFPDLEASSRMLTLHLCVASFLLETDIDIVVKTFVTAPHVVASYGYRSVLEVASNSLSRFYREVFFPKYHLKMLEVRNDCKLSHQDDEEVVERKSIKNNKRARICIEMI
eukprot:PhM_4_TR3092/c0_g1_i1/m.106822